MQEAIREPRLVKRGSGLEVEDDLGVEQSKVRGTLDGYGCTRYSATVSVGRCLTERTG